jgi:hypothetical protein
MLPFAAIALAAFAGTLLLYLSGRAGPVAASHLALAVGVMPLIHAAMLHFVPVLTRRRPPDATVWILPTGVLAAGTLAWLGFFVPFTDPRALTAAAALGMVSTFGFGAWMVRHARHSIGPAHPCVHWYVAAVLCLALALAAVVAMEWLPWQRPALRRFHLHLNTLGFIALTAVGTLHVLLPTVAGRPDSDAAGQLRRHLGWAVSGALLIAAGAAWIPPLGWLGMLTWLVALIRLARAWIRRYAVSLVAPHSAVTALTMALTGLILLLPAGALHGTGALAGRDAVVSFFVLFLLPLVTGTLSHLLPLWWRPGESADRLETHRRRIARFSGLRALLFGAGGILVLAGLRTGLLLAAAGLVLFLFQLLRPGTQATATYPMD